MLTEINKDFYCSAGFNVPKKGFEIGYCQILKGACGKSCSAYHRKHPTPEQFKEEYNEKWTGAVYYRRKTKWIEETKTREWTGWFLASYEDYKYERSQFDECVLFEVVCACTPWGKPPYDWRPK